MQDKSSIEAVKWKSIVLNYYKQTDVQKAIVTHSKDKEVVGSYEGQGYAKRPDILQYPRDVFELVMQGITSFHGSEELWNNALAIKPSMKKEELVNLRKGWDLVLDIDCPYWELSKLTAWLMVKALKEHGIKSISAKFSGNKGFHLGVPFESFPTSVNGVKTRLLFPEAARKIAQYLLVYIDENIIKIDNDQNIIFDDFTYSLKKLKELTGKEFDELTYYKCKGCNKRIPSNQMKKKKYRYVCVKCGCSIETTNDSFKSCSECGGLFQRNEIEVLPCSCKDSEYSGPFFDAFSIVEVDTILISSRHLYRIPYSLHEKSQLASIPIDPEKIMGFEKCMATPAKVEINDRIFLDRKNASSGEAVDLFDKAYDQDFDKDLTEKRMEKEQIKREFEDFVLPEKAIPDDYFAPCIKNILKGLKDGKKRSLFVLVNYLTSLGWGYEKINTLLEEWNKKNSDPLRETVIVGQLRYHKANKKKILPPNCDNNMYYKDILVCVPDNVCERIKNPVQYSKRKIYFLNRQNKSKRKSKAKVKREVKKETSET